MSDVVTSPPAEREQPAPRRFPDHFVRDSAERFAMRWATRRRLYYEFAAAWNEAGSRFVDQIRGELLWPGEVACEWAARWADGLFVGFVPSHEDLAPEEVVASVRDVCALVEAVRFVTHRGRVSAARWVQILEYKGPVKHRRLAFDPGEDSAPPNHLHMDPFLAHAEGIFRTPADHDWEWYKRLEFVHREPVWEDDRPPWEGMANRELRIAVPGLSAHLDIDPAEIADSTLPFGVLMERVQKWCRAAREKITVGIPTGNGRAATPSTGVGHVDHLGVRPSSGTAGSPGWFDFGGGSTGDGFNARDISILTLICGAGPAGFPLSEILSRHFSDGDVERDEKAARKTWDSYKGRLQGRIDRCGSSSKPVITVVNGQVVLDRPAA